MQLLVDSEIEVEIDPNDFFDFDLNPRPPLGNIGNTLNTQDRRNPGFNPFPGKENNPPRNREE